MRRPSRLFPWHHLERNFSAARAGFSVRARTQILVVGRVQCASLRPKMCGVVGIYGHAEAANLAYLGLHALQHRGQESAGIVSTDGDKLRWVREMGHVGDIFTADRLAHLSGFAA